MELQDDSSIPIEIAYFEPERPLLLQLRVPSGTTVADAIARSDFAKYFPHVVISEHKVGIFSKIVSFDYVLQPKDRIEIYRPLRADPKESRRKRAKQQEQD